MLFCVGGRGASGDPYKTIECYHPMKGRWFQVTEMNTRRRHVGVCSYNGNHTARYNKNSNILHRSIQGNILSRGTDKQLNGVFKQLDL